MPRRSDHLKLTTRGNLAEGAAYLSKAHGVVDQRIAQALNDFADYLKRYRDARHRRPLGQSTQKWYVQTVKRAMRATRSTKANVLVDWLHAQINERTPRGTADALVPAIRRYSEHTGAQLDPDAFPYIGHLPKGYRDGLDEENLKLYVESVDGEDDFPDAVRTILLLLPEVGLRIAEICPLTGTDLEVRSDHLGVMAMGKGQKLRWVPLNRRARALLNRLHPKLKLKADDGPRPNVGPLFATSPDTVRRYLAQARQDWPKSLREITPHSLRHGFATRALRSGMPMAMLQAIIGHAPGSRTTARYLHPSSSDLAKVMDALDGDAPESS